MDFPEESLRAGPSGFPPPATANRTGETRLRPAADCDARELMSWFSQRNACLTWGGPAFRYPFTPASFIEDMRLASLSGYALTDDTDTLLGFGQIYPKLNRIHLARLAVHPEMRGGGLGKRLISKLVEAGQAAFAWREASLFVYRQNTAAHRCYRQMGFVDTAWPEGDRVLRGCVFMVRSDAGSVPDGAAAGGLCDGRG